MPPFYDSLLGKIIAHGADRAAGAHAPARRGGRDALDGRGHQSGVPRRGARRRRILSGRRRHWISSRGCSNARRTPRGRCAMADVQLVETSLRDGNQCLWSALGVDTARTLSIAPHHGSRSASRPSTSPPRRTWASRCATSARIRGSASGSWRRRRRTRRCSSWAPGFVSSPGRRRAPEFMALAYRVLARHGIRRFCLADPMNDAVANVAERATGETGRRRIRDRGAGVHAEPDSRRCALRRMRAHARREPRRRCRLHQGSGRAAVAEARRDADSRRSRRRSATSRWSCTRTTPSGSRK